MATPTLKPRHIQIACRNQANSDHPHKKQVNRPAHLKQLICGPHTQKMSISTRTKDQVKFNPYLKIKIILVPQTRTGFISTQHWNEVNFDTRPKKQGNFDINTETMRFLNLWKTSRQVRSLHWNQVKFDLPHWYQVNFDHRHKNQVNFDACTKPITVGPRTKSKPTTTTQTKTKSTDSHNKKKIGFAPHTTY